ncbi:hypothetical protein ATANTOWER_001773, partial [Ataeniobius toweri]|nr:hypothetical protein [Ataeniobius toweri]
TDNPMVTETSPERENTPRGMNSVNAAGETLLHRACKRNQVETVLQILALPGTDINVKGKTPLRFRFSGNSPRSCSRTACSGVSEERLTMGEEKELRKWCASPPRFKL